MARTVIERRDSMVFLFVGIVAIFFLLGIAAFVIIGIIYALAVFLFATVILFYALFVIIQGKEMIVIDKSGLTLNGHVKLGIIPWDCISNVSVQHTLWAGNMMYVYVTNIPKLKDIFGEETVSNKVIDMKTGEKIIQMEMNFCKLKGIDLETLIKDYANGRIN
jgi:hypothetical protein